VVNHHGVALSASEHVVADKSGSRPFRAFAALVDLRMRLHKLGLGSGDGSSLGETGEAGKTDGGATVHMGDNGAVVKG
jgi:hypothetical protein